MPYLFSVYDTDEDDEGCVSLHVNTDVIYGREVAEALACLIEGAFLTSDQMKQEGLTLKEGAVPDA